MSSVDDVKPFIVKPFGCVICNGIFAIEKEFMEQCSDVCYSPVEDEFVELFEKRIN